MQKIIGTRDALSRLKYMIRVCELVKSGELSEEDAICLINEYHGSIVLKKEHFIKHDK